MTNLPKRGGSYTRAKPDDTPKLKSATKPAPGRDELAADAEKKAGSKSKGKEA